MASLTDNHNPGEGGAATRRRRRRRKKNTRTVATQTCSEIAPNFYSVLQEKGPSECEGIVQTQYYPDGEPDEDGWEDDWEQEWWKEEYGWWSQGERDASMEFEMEDETNTTGSSRWPFGWLRDAWSSRRTAQRNSMVGGEEECGKGGSSSSRHRDPQDGDDAGKLGRALHGKGEFQAKGSKSAQ